MVEARVPNRRGEGELLRGELLAAATRLLERGGRDTELTLRAVAREAGVSAPSVYPHFADLDELVLELVATHLADLAAALRRADNRATRAHDADPAERLAAVARAYVRWGLSHPGPYTVVFEGRALRQLSTEQEAAMTRDSGLLDEVAALVAAQVPAPADPEVAALALWTSLHGLVALRLSKPAFPWPSLGRHVAAAVHGTLG